MSMKLVVAKFEKNNFEFEIVSKDKKVGLNKFLEDIIWDYTEKISSNKGNKSDEDEVVLDSISKAKLEKMSSKIDEELKKRFELWKLEKGNETRENIFDEITSLTKINEVIKSFCFELLKDSDVKLIII